MIFVCFSVDILHLDVYMYLNTFIFCFFTHQCSRGVSGLDLNTFEIMSGKLWIRQLVKLIDLYLIDLHKAVKMADNIGRLILIQFEM